VLLFEILDFNHQALVYKDTDIYDKDNFYRVAWGNFIIIFEVFYDQLVSVRIILERLRFSFIDINIQIRKDNQCLITVMSRLYIMILFGIIIKNMRDF